MASTFTERWVTQVELIGQAQFTAGILNLRAAMLKYQDAIKMGQGASTIAMYGKQLDMATANLKAFGQTFAALTVIASMKSLAEQSLQVGIEFENVRLSLLALYRDADKAEDAFSWMKNFVKTTPFDLQNLQEAMVNLLSFNIQPTNKNLRLIGGIAKIFRREMRDVSMAVARGAYGDFRRLRGFGLDRSEVDELAKNLKGMELKMLGYRDRVAIIFDALNKKHGGMLDAFAKSTEQSISNLSDTWKEFIDELGGKSATGGASAFSQFFISILEGLMTFLRAGKAIFADIFATFGKYMLTLSKVIDFFHGGRESDKTAFLKGWVETMNQRALENWGKVFPDASNENPPEAKSNSLGDNGEGGGGDMSKLTRLILGGGLIAQRGISGLDVPGFLGKNTTREPIKIKIETNRGSAANKFFEDMFNQYEQQMASRGYRR